jgi:hypothetical protein
MIYSYLVAPLSLLLFSLPLLTVAQQQNRPVMEAVATMLPMNNQQARGRVLYSLQL